MEKGLTDVTIFHFVKLVTDCVSQYTYAWDIVIIVNNKHCSIFPFTYTDIPGFSIPPPWHGRICRVWGRREPSDSGTRMSGSQRFYPVKKFSLIFRSETHCRLNVYDCCLNLCNNLWPDLSCFGVSNHSGQVVPPRSDVGNESMRKDSDVLPTLVSTCVFVSTRDLPSLTRHSCVPPSLVSNSRVSSSTHVSKSVLCLSPSLSPDRRLWAYPSPSNRHGSDPVPVGSGSFEGLPHPIDRNRCNTYL